jgi:prepilin-type N-terminal cleavage/methylation domain-containing protein
MNRGAAFWPENPEERARNSEQGFTLLEVVVTLLLLSMLGGVALSSFRTGLNSYEASQTRLEDEARRRTLQDYLRRQIGSIYPVQPSGSFMETEGGNVDPAQGVAALLQTPLFYGQMESVVFATVAPLALLDHPGLTLVRYGLSQDAEGAYFLGATEDRYIGLQSFDSMVSAPQGAPIPLIDEVASLSFHYYGYDPQSEAYQWFNTWVGEEMGSVPRAIRIDFDDQHVTVLVNAVASQIRGRRAFQRTPTGR